MDLDLRAKTMHMMGVGDLRQDAAWQTANPETVQELLEMAEASAAVGAGEPNREVGARLQLLARQDHDTYDRLPSLTMPVFICGGRYDGTAPVGNQYALNAQIPHAQLALFDGGHGFLQQDPAAYIQIIKFFENNQ